MGMKIGKDITAAKALLEKGKLVAIPTETVYGLAANGMDAVAVASIFEAKQRPSFNPLILHVPDQDVWKQLVKEVPVKAQLLADAFWPGPLTLVLPKTDIVPDIVTAGNDTVAVRMPANDMTRELLASLCFPLAAPSANPSGYISPTLPGHVLSQLGDKVSYVLDGGPSTVGVESTIVKVIGDEVTILRYGGLPIEDIEAVVGEVSLPQAHAKIEASGMLTSHYAPSKKLLLGDKFKLIEHTKGEDVLILNFSDLMPDIAAYKQLVLSRSGDLKEAAAALFGHLRALDAMDGMLIIAELVPDMGLGKAINDRLRRAAADRS